MSVRDIKSNYLPEMLWTNESVAGGGGLSNTPPIDLGQSETSIIGLNADSSSLVNFAAALVTLEFSIDVAFTTPVVDPLISGDPLGITEAGNQILTDSGSDFVGYDGSSVTLLQGISHQFYARILNPPAVITSGDIESGNTATHFRYARLTFANSQTAAANVNAFGMSGPKRFVSAE